MCLGAGAFTTCCNFVNAGGNCVEDCPQNSNSTEGFNCDCLPGYTGANCNEDIDECDPSPCQNNGSCTDMVNGYTCECDTGYTGPTCLVPPLCNDDIPCANGGTCLQSSNYTCECDAGYTGPTCLEPPICNDDIPCENGGTCEQGSDGQTSCLCPDGFQGTQCGGNVYNNNGAFNFQC